MTGPHLPRRRYGTLLALGACALVGATGCGWQGLNSMQLPGAAGHEPGSTTIHVELANIGTLVSNSPVMIDDVVVGSVGAITLRGWHADVEVALRPATIVPANAVAAIGQTSLLGSSHLALNTPPGVAPAGQLPPGAVIPLHASSTYPSTEQTLAAVSVVVNGGGLGQIGDIIHSLNEAFAGRTDKIAALLTRLDTLMSTLDGQRHNIVATIEGLNRLAGTFAAQRDTVTEVLRTLPPALDALIAARPDLVTALDRLKTFSTVASGVVTEVRGDLVTNLEHLEPTLSALADVGDRIAAAIAFATTYPYGQYGIDHALKGDYVNLMATVDLTIPRLRRELLLGTPWGDPTAVIQAAVGDPGYATQTRDPLAVGIQPPIPVPQIPVPELPFPIPGGR
ncbi:MCE family protein [Nocardia goodfellowii]|uniref:Virulence factor Mce-like protein n=1 Tax=Nocardia goodfellowii TaxID=882446 RepID=A0ABS4QJM8_9NOCA|nr:MCE family protein [Nocardia goodfellowii]MBP2191912.1 virulence factor Mce-like protein [Nocardia goodfellowii]